MNNKSLNKYICAIVKDEQLYVNDWIDYHLKKGFTKIVIYNNGYTNYNVDEYGDDVEIIDWHPIDPIPNQQVMAYNHFLKTHQNMGCALFIDIDEYLWGEIPQRGNIVLEDITYDANQQLFYKEEPVYVRFTREAVLNMTCNIKTYVDLSNSGSFVSCHRTDALLTDIDGNIIPDHCIKNGTTRSSYIRHYLTKSLEEYLAKLKRGNITKGLRTLDYFFRVNPDMLSSFKQIL